MLLDWDIGVSGCGRSFIAEHKGKINRVRFSYSANRLKSLLGMFESLWAMVGFFDTILVYLETVLESK